ncbi:VWA domain-containing protein [Agrobacterium vitis]|uniref:vWA domain-containing protein n=1 Tax=Rhizobium/Agrobacterium group TaxID=227290 RepID=UPI0008DBF00C|nr:MULTISPECIES: vWA domain-containing protein [Rhizobium/Agrobacterium group]MCF1434663.1 VWA domain-containing protein [Allorhizobium ampelinum]MCF1473047.1 VWA domain-containing protein [Allorhizobium ampelinum]MUO88387.1 VWA domain-containing protein [Agrobacterium vitis]MUZ53785.1 VWA domain-containing protein [Agrobacterium vitis]MUZ90459.1 VWA domain-containing protein [Agrobacterium vitis]
MRFRDLLSKFIADDNGNFAIMSAILLMPLLLAVGAALDYSSSRDHRNDIQVISDSAILAAASSYSSSSGVDALAAEIDSYLASDTADQGANDVDSAAVPKRLSGPTLSADGKEICVVVGESVPTSFMQLAGVKTVNVSVKSCAALPGNIDLEVSLVLDVSSSMIEEGRFGPMQTAVKSFLTSFANDATVAKRSKIAIAPFSSRFNIGLPHKDWLKAYGGNAAVPSRWTDPKSYYSSSSYSFTQWIDNVTPLAYTSKNYYWIGCVEPRADVEMKDSGSIGTNGLSDAPPSTEAFVAQDSNSGSSTSFCPPPIVSLTSSFSTLQSAIANMTSEGSTRLDAGMLAGWYTLSPKWRSAWGGGTSPADYSEKVKKVIVFMTDGEMNVKYGPSDSDKLDWICNKTRTSACNDIATNALLTTCDSIKSNNIEIYAISYSSEADVQNLQTCSSGTKYYFSASTTNIKDVYTAISKNIIGSTVRLTQ